MCIKRLDNYRLTIPIDKGTPTFIARTRGPIPEQFSTEKNSKLNSGELSNLNAVKYVYM